MLRLMRFICAIVATGAVVGCANNPGKTTGDLPTMTELAAYAGSHKFPTTQPTDELKVAAIVNKDRSLIKIYNFTNQPFSPVDVWVNRAYVIHLLGITANGNIEIKSTDIYNGLGRSLASQAEPISQVQIQTGSGFYNVMGPQAE